MSASSQERLEIGRHECHVWRVALDLPADITGYLQNLLSVEERTRAALFAFATDRRRFVVAHGCLRQILGRYLGADPACLVIAKGTLGKPVLASPPTVLCFSLSHSGDTALVAVAWDREVGVDLEAVRPLGDVIGLAASCFSAAEKRTLGALPEEVRLDCFFDGWTRKEAFVKLLGEGLSRPLDTFDVTLAPGEPARLLRVAGARAGDWSLRAIEVGSGYRGALAIEGHPRAICVRDWVARPEAGRNDGGRRERRHESLLGGGERGTVRNLAGEQGAPQRLASRGQERDEERVPRVDQGSLDRHDDGEPAGGPVREGLTVESSLAARAGGCS